MKGPGFTCTKCSENIWGIVSAVVAAVVTVVMAFVAIKYVTSADMGRGRGITSRLLRRVPHQSVKIIIVSWQVLTQVSYDIDVVRINMLNTFFVSGDVRYLKVFVRPGGA